jgi:glycosyltransferase involved in cell wall biosynthesis
MLTRWADKKHHKLELQVIQEADFVTTVTQEDADDFTKKGAQNTRCITNGYDDEFHSGIAIDSHFTLVHVGSIPPARNHEILWKVIQKLSLELPGFSEYFKLKLIGKTDIGVRKSIQKYHLEKYCELIEYIPHAKAIEMQQSAQMLLLLVNNSGNAKSILTGKFFEYLAAQRPIIAIGPTDGEMNRILQDSQAGACADFEDAKALENILIENFKKFLSQSPLTISSSGIEKYSRRSLTHEMSKVFEQILNNHEKQKN